eukprot:12416327-Karenia_brevis.AAC.1
MRKCGKRLRHQGRYHQVLIRHRNSAASMPIGWGPKWGNQGSHYWAHGGISMSAASAVSEGAVPYFAPGMAIPFDGFRFQQAPQ